MEWNGVCYRLMIRQNGILCWKTRNLSTSSVDSNENDDNWPSPEKIQNFLSKYRLTFSQRSFLINDLWTKQFLSGNLILNRNSFTQVYLLTQMREKFPSFDSFYNRKVNGTSGKTHVVPIYRSSGNFQSQRAVFQFAMRQWPPRYHPRRHGIASRRESSRANLEDRPFEEAIDGTTIETRYWERRDRRSIQLDCCCIYQPRSVTLRVHRLLITNFVNFFLCFRSAFRNEFTKLHRWTLL